MLRQQKEKKRQKQQLRNENKALYRSCKSKVRFECQSEATKSGKTHGLRPYYCSFCDGWHLTKRKRWEDQVSL